MSRNKRLSPDQWEAVWASYLFKGSTMMVLENLAVKVGITVDELKERIQTPTQRQVEVEILRHS